LRTCAIAFGLSMAGAMILRAGCHHPLGNASPSRKATLTVTWAFGASPHEAFLALARADGAAPATSPFRAPSTRRDLIRPATGGRPAP